MTDQQPDPMALLDLMFPSTVPCLAVAARYQIADVLVDGPRAVEDIAERAGVTASALHKVLQVLAEDGIFAEVKPGVFENTPLSTLLRPGVPKSQYSMARLIGEPWLWSCWGRLDHSVETGKAAFDEIFNINTWAWFGQHQDEARLFDGAMTDFSEALGERIVEAYPEAGAAGVIADLGGGQGTFLATFLNAHASIRRGLLVDLPPVISKAKERPELAGLVGSGRLDFVPGDFFQSVPADVDLYVTKQIMHSWNDERLVALLRRCREASPRATVAAAELVQRPGVPRFVKNFNLIMLITMAGAIRTDDDFAAVFEQAGYRLNRIVPTDSAFSIIEAVPVP